MTRLLASGASPRFDLPQFDLPQFDPGLFLDTFESADRYVPVRVRHRHPPTFRRVFELLVAPNLIHLIPAVFLLLLHDVTAVHFSSRSLGNYNTHDIHTGQYRNTHLSTLKRADPSAPTSRFYWVLGLWPFSSQESESRSKAADKSVRSTQPIAALK